MTIPAVALIAACEFAGGEAGSSPATPAQIYYRAFRRLASYPMAPFVVWSDLWKVTVRAPGPDSFSPGLESTQYSTVRYAARTADEVENISELRTSAGLLPKAIIGPVFQGPFAWTLHPPSAKPAPAPSGGPDLSALKVIAYVTAYDPPPYAIDVSGREDVDGRSACHLRLRALSDPDKHNLRDLWIDLATYDIVKAHYTGTYAPYPDAPSSPSDITAYLKAIAQYWIAYRMVWTYQDRASFLMDVSTIEVAFPGQLPDWLFDPIAYPSHVRANEPDLLYYVLHAVATPSPAPSPT